MPALSSATIGFPRIGPKREMKKALEDYWAGKSSEADLVATSHAIEAQAWTSQLEAGIDLIALDGTYYDQILDTISYLGLIPERFNTLSNAPSGLDRYFAAARGTTSSTALDMSKYFDTNYHQIVPELNADSTPNPDWSPLLDRVRRGQAVVGAAKAVPLLVGPLTFVALSRGEFNASEMTKRLIPAYVKALNELATLGVPEVQVSLLLARNFIFYIFLLLPFSLYKLYMTDQNGMGFKNDLFHILFLYSILIFHCSPQEQLAFISRSRLFCCCIVSFFLFNCQLDPWLIWKALLI
jgi:Cobalamin-independent synthase, N-terminal domain